MTVVDVLRKARNLVALNWTREQYARNADGKAVSPTSRQAVAFCAVGAVMSVTGIYCKAFAYHKPNFNLCKISLEYLHKATPRGCAIIANDRARSSRTVLRYFDSAIKYAKECEAE